MKRKRKKISEKDLEKRKLRKEVREIFRNTGFAKVKSVSDKEFEFKEGKGDFDDVFIYENIIVLLEYTCTDAKYVGDHLKGKKILFDLVLENKREFIEFLEKNFEEFKKSRDQRYPISQCELNIVYCSQNMPDKEHKKQFPKVKFLDYPILQYFLSVSKVIKKSARFETFDFLGLKYENIGEKVLSTSSSKNEVYEGHILPEENSSFSKGFKVVSFYIDAESIIKRAYVLRKSGWKTVDGMYQRMLIKSKITKMRKYLKDKDRVFVNNIIVSLPGDETKLLDKEGNVVKSAVFTRTQPVKIQIEEGFNLVGLIDGQHRVYAYHEGNDIYEEKIASLRKIQNLLVTGVIYPSTLDDDKRVEFEANLFLEINSNQSVADSELRQSIQLILEPFTNIAIAKGIVNQLALEGPLKGYLKSYFFEKALPTTSIVSYGLIPLVKTSGTDSLFSTWKEKDKEDVANKKNKKLLNEYKEYCISQINTFLGAYKNNIPEDLWTTDQKVSRFLTTTSINGLISCMRLVIENKKLGDFSYYDNKLKEISKFDFKSYKSSQWRSLGETLYNKYFA